MIRPSAGKSSPPSAPDYLKRYQHKRRAGLAAPPAAGMRLYESRWDTLDPWAPTAGNPDHINLLFDSQSPAAPPAPDVDSATVRAALKKGSS